ncbi:MAG: hypothetical protein JSS79_07555 [Bacteroidetes bacterium]|nr:hypothetical protein [Bacteroidota bacterium]
MKKFIFLLCALVGSFSVQAQKANLRADNVRWNATSLTDLNTNTTSATACYFTTYSGTKIDWVQGNGNYTIHWNVDGVEGTWSDATQPGTLTYSVSALQGKDHLTGRLSITRSDVGITLILKFNGVTEQFNLSYQISSYAVQ